MSGYIAMENENASSDSNSDSESGLKLNLDKVKRTTQTSMSEGDSHFVRQIFINCCYYVFFKFG